MKHSMSYFLLSVIVFTAAFFVSCNKIDDFIDHGHSGGTKGYVYTTSNESGKNNILIFKQEANGSLMYKTKVASGGTGKGMSLSSQGALILDKYHQWMYTVNAGDNTISSFKVSADGNVTLHQTIHSGGVMPVSLTVHHSWLYVVNAGGNICGFKISSNGHLAKIEGSSKALSSPTAGPAEILFKPDGSLLVVTEKATNKIVTYKLNAEGVAQAPVVYPAHAETPFGFVFAGNDHLIVTDAFGGRPGESVVTSLLIGNNNVTLKSYVPVHESAACWVVLTKKEDFAYVTNTASNTISSLRVESDGKLHLVDSVVAKTGKSPTDICLSGNAAFIYTVNEMSGTIGEYRILPHGRLHPLGDVSGIPTSAVGLAAF